jgi:hypothetical protein
MSGTERIDTKAGPLGNLSQLYFGSFDSVVRTYEPALKGVGRWNLELFGLMVRRSQAWLGVPAQFAQCKTPMDVVGEQIRFWQSAGADYVDGSRRLMAALGPNAYSEKLNGALPRDYITFNEPKDEPEPSSKRGERKAA